MLNRGKGCFLTVIMLCAFLSLNGQENGTFNSYSLYSIYGVGDISKEGTAFNKSMGGVGIATRNRRFVNIMNPAAVTARDSSSFMADFGIVQKNTVYRQNDLRSGNNTFNIYDFVLSFPIYRSSAVMLGITPFSDLGYNFTLRETNPDIIGNTGNITYDSYGEGSIYQLFLAGGVTFWKRLSIGAQGNFYFGTLDKIYNVNYTESSYGSLNTGYNIMPRGFTGKFGLQYQQPFGNNISLVIGATYRMKTNLKGQNVYYKQKVTSDVVDTLVYNEARLSASGLSLGDEIGVGIALKQGERWSVELNYLRSDWSKSGFEAVDGFSVSGSSAFSSGVSQSFRAGFEIVPNRNDIRYYLRRCAYRAGVYYDQANYKLDGNSVNTIGVTLGVTLPVFRWYNGLSIGIDAGQRGVLKGNMVRERYVSFVVGFNIFDIWFQKPRYN